MANRKLTILPELTVFEDDDWDYVVDKSDTLESPEGTSKKARKSTTWDYIRGKADARYSMITAIESYPFDGDGQDYTLPDGFIATKCWINDYVQHKEKAGFESRLNTFTQIDNILTFKQTVESTDRIDIDGYIQ